MSVRMLLVLLSMGIGSYSGMRAQTSPLQEIYPFTSFKKVIDTSMRCYTDLLILEERLAAHERSEELVDLLVGRFTRLSTYIDQIVHDYKKEATILSEEIEYLIQLLEYMEITAESLKKETIPANLNVILVDLKNKLKNTL